MDEHEFEDVRGLPDRLPEGERLLWQGAPDWKSLARRAYHVPALAAYFAVIWLWYVADVWSGGASVAQALLAGVPPLVLALVCLAFVVGIAYAAARGTVYTVTDRRIVMRHGIALSMSVNLPFALIEGAGLKPHADGTGDVALQLVRGQRVGYLVSWPHVRPWRFTRTEPSLRSVPDAAQVGALIAQSLAEYHGVPLRAAATASAPSSAPAGAAARPAGA